MIKIQISFLKKLNEITNKYKKLLIEDYVKFISLCSLNLFRHRCPKDDCKVSFLTGNFSDVNVIKLTLRDQYFNMNNEIKILFGSGYIKHKCNRCNLAYFNYKYKEETRFINFPIYLTFSLKSIVKSARRNQLLIGATVFLNEIKEINFFNQASYIIKGIVCVKDNYSFYSVIFKDDKWIISGNENEIYYLPTLPNAYLLFYLKKDDISK